jgi:superfamily I DNA/RNA helicase
MGLDKDLMTNRRSEAPKLELLRKPVPELNFSYSEKQSEVISHSGQNPLIVLGGPGTGKTQTLIAQALTKIDAGIDPNSILILTFGRDRADYLRDEISLRSPKTANEPLARTFHALAFSIVRMATPEDKPDPILFSGSEQDSYIKQMLLTDSADNLSGWPKELKAALPTRGFAKELRDVLLRATERGLYPEKLSEYAKTYSENYWSPIAKFWDRYILSLIHI